MNVVREKRRGALSRRGARNGMPRVPRGTAGGRGWDHRIPWTVTGWGLAGNPVPRHMSRDALLIKRRSRSEACDVWPVGPGTSMAVRGGSPLSASLGRRHEPRHRIHGPRACLTTDGRRASRRFAHPVQCASRTANSRPEPTWWSSWRRCEFHVKRPARPSPSRLHPRCGRHEVAVPQRVARFCEGARREFASSGRGKPEAIWRAPRTARRSRGPSSSVVRTLITSPHAEGLSRMAGARRPCANADASSAASLRRRWTDHGTSAPRERPRRFNGVLALRPRHRESETHDPKSPDGCERIHAVISSPNRRPCRGTQSRTRTGRRNPTRQPLRRTRSREPRTPTPSAARTRETQPVPHETHGPANRVKPPSRNLRARPPEKPNTLPPRTESPAPKQPSRHAQPPSSARIPTASPPSTGPRARGRAGLPPHRGWEIDPSSNPVLAA